MPTTSNWFVTFWSPFGIWSSEQRLEETMGELSSLKLFFQIPTFSITWFMIFYGDTNYNILQFVKTKSFNFGMILNIKKKKIDKILDLKIYSFIRVVFIFFFYCVMFILFFVLYYILINFLYRVIISCIILPDV